MRTVAHEDVALGDWVAAVSAATVSYTHQDVYKRQPLEQPPRPTDHADKNHGDTLRTGPTPHVAQTAHMARV